MFMESLAARLKGVPFSQPRKARARCPRDSRRDADATVFFPQAVMTCPSQTIYEMAWVLVMQNNIQQ